MFSKRLRELRKLRGLTQEQLGDLVGVTRISIINYEKGYREPDFDTLTKIANALCTTTDYLLGRTDAKFPEIIAESYEQYLAPTGDRREDYQRRVLLNKYIATGRKLTIDQLKLLTKLARQMAQNPSSED